MRYALWMAGAGVCALAFASLPSIITPASAEETGVASIHSWVKVGRKTCMADHYHDGVGTGKNRKLAERSAVDSWAGFTAWEYGDTWGRWSLAVSKSVDCSKTSGGDVSCRVSARPCRPF